MSTPKLSPELQAEYNAAMADYEALEKVLNAPGGDKEALYRVRAAKRSLENQHNILKLYEHLAFFVDTQHRLSKMVNVLTISVIIIAMLLAVNALATIIFKAP